MNKSLNFHKLMILFVLLFSGASVQASLQPWSATRANEWYTRQGWIVGSNYIPASAVNQLEMWQAETFDPARIDRELTLAQRAGMRSIRVFLHDQVWSADPKGFRARIDRFLQIASSHRIKPIFVLLDSCWDPRPHLGKQLLPRPGVHNSRWVQSPGYASLSNPSDYPRLAKYVEGVIRAFSHDPRILAWDLWNEPDNLNGSSYVDPLNKIGFVQNLLPAVFQWARAAHPMQPLTSAIWGGGEWGNYNALSAVQKMQITLSDVVSFHNYGTPKDFATRVRILQQTRRPLLCTEYMARPLGSTIASILPLAKAAAVAMFNWGFVAGKTQTYLAWDTWQHPATGYPLIWFHDLFYTDGTPYRREEISIIQRLTTP